MRKRHYEYQDDGDVSEVPMKMRKRGRKSAVPGWWGCELGSHENEEKALWVPGWWGCERGSQEESGLPANEEPHLRPGLKPAFSLHCNIIRTLVQHLKWKSTQLIQWATPREAHSLGKHLRDRKCGITSFTTQMNLNLSLNAAGQPPWKQGVFQ